MAVIPKQMVCTVPEIQHLEMTNSEVGGKRRNETERRGLKNKRGLGLERIMDFNRGDVREQD